MPAARPFTAADDQPGRQPLSSWYTQGLSDGLGDRLLMFDNQATGPLELLRVRPDFAFVPDFETRLRGRLDKLANFSHPGFAQCRAVDHLDNGEGLTVVSTHVPGTRLTEIFAAARKQRAGMHVTAARWALGELMSSMAALHGQHPGVAHGALAPERVVITADRDVVITDYIFGDALGAMHLSAERLWNECGVVSLPQRDFVPIDQRSDVVQLALIAIALIRGSRVTPEEYAQRGRLLEEFSAACNREMPVSARALRSWMEQALNPNAFRSAVDANAALVDLVNPVQMQQRSSARRAATESPAALRQPPQAPSPEREERRALGPALQEASDEAELPRRPLFRLLQWVAAALAVIGVVQGAIIAGLVFRPLPTASPASPSVSQVNAAVDGTSGLEPTAPILPPKPGAVIASSQTATRSDSIVDGAAARGGVRIDSPIVLQVIQGTRTLGTSSAPVYLAPGSHDLVFVNNSLGVRTTQTVQITAGRVVPLSVTLPNGQLSANAQPWAQVLVDGKAIGETPLANVAVPVGEHIVTFRHPQLGERRQEITVQAGVLTRVSASFAP